MTNFKDEVTAQGVRNWQSVRTLLEALILVGVIWLGSSAQEQAKATVQTQTQMSAMRDEIRDLRDQLNGVPQIARGMAKIEVRMDEHERRINELEQVRKLH